METIESGRLRLFALGGEDWPFVLELLNDRSYIRNIRDSGIRTEEQARKYIEDVYRDSHARHGFGLLGVELKESGTRIGICGLLKRNALDHPDLGFALLERWQGQGYAIEAASAVMADARSRGNPPRVLAVIAPDNAISIGLIGKLGFSEKGTIRLSPDGPELNLYEAVL